MKDRAAHARIDALQIEVAHQLSKIKVDAMPPHPGIAVSPDAYAEDILIAFKAADRYVRTTLGERTPEELVEPWHGKARGS